MGQARKRREGKAVAKRGVTDSPAHPFDPAQLALPPAAAVAPPQAIPISRPISPAEYTALKRLAKRGTPPRPVRQVKKLKSR